MSTLPLTFASPNWFTTRFIASRLGVSQRTVQHWAKTGFFEKRGCDVIIAPRLNGLFRCWIRIPNLRADAILRHVTHITLDTLPAAPVGSKS